MDFKKIEKIKKLAIIAMVSDDELMEKLVLKGGNALNIIHKVTSRASWDLDFSIESDFEEGEIEKIKAKIERNLQETFKSEAFEVFDVKITEQPEIVSPEVIDFWGGYVIEFKIIDKNKFDSLIDDRASLRRNAEIVATGQRKKFKIEISKYEYCKQKEQLDLEDFSIFVYTPAMIVIEKIRAICQQMPEYLNIIKKMRGKARARDFFDIYTVFEHFNIELSRSENIDILKNMFAIKRVPLTLIGKIKDYKEFHRPDFKVVEETILILPRFFGHEVKMVFLVFEFNRSFITDSGMSAFPVIEHFDILKYA